MGAGDGADTQAAHPPPLRESVLAFRVAEVDDRLRLDQLLAARIPEVSRMRLRRLIEGERVSVNGTARAPGWRVATGDEVSLRGDLSGTSAMTPEPLPLTVLFEDGHLVVVEKPAGMVVHPAGRHTGGTLTNALAYHFNIAGAAHPPIRPGIVHRLDRATSGVMVVAKTQQALSNLTIQFQERRVRKLYLALVHEAVTPTEGHWEAAIGADPAATPKWGIRGDGRPATSRYRALDTRGEFTLLELEPLTGRTNQLRLHAAHFGHPIAGDALFGRGPLPGLDRLFLHAHRLEFAHPVTGAPLVMESPLPVDLTSWAAPDAALRAGAPMR